MGNSKWARFKEEKDKKHLHPVVEQKMPNSSENNMPQKNHKSDKVPKLNSGYSAKFAQKNGGKKPQEHDEEEQPRSLSVKAPQQVDQNSVAENQGIYDKLASKIRSQAQRIIELEAQLQESQKDVGKQVQILARNTSNSTKEELLILRKKNDLLNQENQVLREKIDILSKSLEQKKAQLVQNSVSFDFEGVQSDEAGNQKKIHYLTRIGSLETEKIELEEVLRSEIIKNEKLESMLELLKKINEEKLENLGFLSYQGKSRVETVMDAAHVFEQNQELRDLLTQAEQSLAEAQAGTRLRQITRSLS